MLARADLDVNRSVSIGSGNSFSVSHVVINLRGVARFQPSNIRLVHQTNNPNNIIHTSIDMQGCT